MIQQELRHDDLIARSRDGRLQVERTRLRCARCGTLFQVGDFAFDRFDIVFVRFHGFAVRFDPLEKTRVVALVAVAYGFLRSQIAFRLRELAGFVGELLFQDAPPLVVPRFLRAFADLRQLGLGVRIGR